MATSENATWTLSGLIIPTTWLSVIVRYICYACLGVGLMFMFPFVFLIVLDLFLWVWRICTNRKPASSSSTSSRYNATPKLSATEAAASTAAAVVGISDNTAHIRTRSRKA